jgi:hypothetical protein
LPRHKNTGSYKLPGVDNVKGGALAAATLACLRPAYLSINSLKAGPCALLFFILDEMIRPADFARIALSLEGTTEAPHVDRRAFRVRRIFATLAADGLTANLKLTPDEQEFKHLLAPELFVPIPNGWGRQGWTTVMLAAIHEPELRAALEMAWAHAVRK